MFKAEEKPVFTILIILLSVLVIVNGCIDNCISCQRSDCDQCNAGYMYQRYQISCKACVPNCQQCLPIGDCTQCTVGALGRNCETCSPERYYKNSTGYCATCQSSKCIICTGPNICQICITGWEAPTCGNCRNTYYLNTGGACVSCSTISPNCVSCSASDKCTICSAGAGGILCDTCGSVYYKNAEGICISCFSISRQCHTCNDSICSNCSIGYEGDRCDNCSMGYFKNASNSCNSCSDINSNCLECIDRMCLNCTNGFVGDYCNQCDSQVSIFGVCNPCLNISMNCLTCTQNNTCLTCANGASGIFCDTCISGSYENDVGACIACSAIGFNCLTCSYNICHTCKLGYSGNNCSLCATSYIYSSQTFSCQLSSTIIVISINFTEMDAYQLAHYAGIHISPTLDLAPPPPIGQSILFTLPVNNDNKFITAKDKLESFQIIQTPSSANFRVTYLDDTSPTNYNNISIDNMTGIWNYFSSSTSTLSCTIVYSSEQVAALQFNSGGAFNVSSTLNISLFSSFNQSVTPVIGENCNYILHNSHIYYLRSNGYAQVKQFSKIQAYSPSLQYVIDSGILYGIINDTFVDLKANLAPFTFFKISNYHDQLIIQGYNITSNGVSYSIYQTVYIGVCAYGQCNFFTKFSINSINSPNREVFFSISPSMTKIHYQYYNGSYVVVAFKKIDYVKYVVKDVAFQSQARYLATTSKATLVLNHSNYLIGDYFLVVRNSSVEQVYQFISGLLIYFRARSLTTTQNNYSRIFIDQSFSKDLIVLNLYDNVNSGSHGYDVFSYSYGSLSSTIRISPSIPVYLTFTPPSYTSNVNFPQSFEWIYVQDRPSNSSITLYRQDDLVSQNHLVTQSVTVPSDTCIVLAYSKYCFIVSTQNNTEFTLYDLSNSRATAVDVDITSLVLQFTIPIALLISEDCSKFRVNQKIYAKIDGGFQQVNMNMPSQFVLDQLFAYFITNDSIWKYNSNAQTYQQYHINKYIPTMSRIALKSNNNKLIAYQLKNASALVMAFIDTGSAFTTLPIIEIKGFTSTPNIAISPLLSKVIIFGNQNSSASLINLYSIDYSRAAIKEIQFPADLFDPSHLYVSLEETWIYVRQLTSGMLSILDDNQELIYSILGNSVLTLTKSKQISQFDATNWVATHTSTSSNGNLIIYTQIRQASNTSIIVYRYEVVSLATLGRTSNTALGVNPINGDIQLCTPGCNDCSRGICTSCYSGYTLISAANTCLSCASNCLTCSSSNNNHCYSCATRFFMQGTSCEPCSSMCISCSGTAFNCIACQPGKYFNLTFNNCSLCQRNCLSCTSMSCSSCRGGFVAVGNICRSCVITCSSCLPTDITTCTSCHQGLQLINGSCVSCPDKCLLCLNGVCQICINGYHPSFSTSICVKDCILPCATCQDSNPSVCLSCFSGSLLLNNTCKSDLSCNNNSSCTSCGQGNNYILIGGQCLLCDDIPNCLQCRPANSETCSICAIGYYIDNDTKCSNCPLETCVTCISPSVCTQCQIGYTFPNGFTQGQCLKCSQPCQTCLGSKNYCTSCVTGYTKIGWKCQSNINVGFSIILVRSNITNILDSIDEVVDSLLNILNISNDQVDAITFTQIKQNPIVIVGTATPPFISQASIQQAFNALSNQLSSNNSFLGEFKVSSSIVTINSLGEKSSQSSSSSNFPTGLAIGVGIGGILLVFTIVFITWYVKKRASKKQYVGDQNANVSKNVIGDSMVWHEKHLHQHEYDHEHEHEIIDEHSVDNINNNLIKAPSIKQEHQQQMHGDAKSEIKSEVEQPSLKNNNNNNKSLPHILVNNNNELPLQKDADSEANEHKVEINSQHIRRFRRMLKQEKQANAIQGQQNQGPQMSIQESVSNSDNMQIFNPIIDSSANRFQ